MCASRTATVGAVAWFAVVIGGYGLLASQPGVDLPEWAGLVVVGALLVGGGLLLVGLDALRWRRLAHSYGLDRLGNAAVDTPYSVLQTYRGEYDGRTVTMDFQDAPDSVVLDKTVFAAQHDGAVDARVIIERDGAGGTGSSDLPPAVDIASESFTDQFSVHSGAPEFARAVVTAGVQDALLELEDPIDVVVETDRVRARCQGRHIDADASETYLDAVCRLADAVEAESR
jgi:hypothetical protein